MENDHPGLERPLSVSRLASIRIRMNIARVFVIYLILIAGPTLLAVGCLFYGFQSPEYFLGVLPFVALTGYAVGIHRLNIRWIATFQILILLLTAPVATMPKGGNDERYLLAVSCVLLALTLLATFEACRYRILTRDDPMWDRRLAQFRRRPTLFTGKGRTQLFIRLAIIVLLFFATPERIGGMLLAPFILFLLHGARKRVSLGVEELLARDKRQPILLLRSFQDDAMPIKLNLRINFLGRWRISVEEVLSNTLHRFGPVITIGRPGERLPLLGASREYVDDDRWQDRVRERIAQSRLIILILGESRGLGWEIQTLVKMDAMDRVILVVPPIPPSHPERLYIISRWHVFGDYRAHVRAGLERRWGRFRSEYAAARGPDGSRLALPAGLNITDIRAIIFRGGELVPVTSRGFKEFDYQEALAQAARMLVRQPQQTMASSARSGSVKP